MALPTTIGRYQIVGRLASGGMAEILLGKLLGPSGFERAVVIKRILPHLVAEQRFVTMFLDEARTVARIRHPNVVQVNELGQDTDNGELFLAMEYLDGESAYGLMKRLRHVGEMLPFGLAAHIVAEACAGLHAAHELTDNRGQPVRLVHRDVSPQNVMVLYDGQVKVLDFGIAKGADTKHKTEAGQIKGKFAYMSPEQCRGESLDRRSDIFALGTLLFELSTGRRLFTREGDLKTLKAICEEPMVTPSMVMRGYPPRLESICMRALSRLREDRYQTALEMRRDLLGVMREIVVDPVPEDVLGRLMKRIFEDRIEEKEDMLRRIRAGSQLFQIPSVDTDSSVEIPIVVDDSNLGPAPHPAPSEPLGTGSTRSLRSAWMAVAAVLVVAVVIGVGFAMFGGGDDGTASVDGAREDGTPVPTSTATSGDDDTSAAGNTPTPPTDVAPASVTVEVESTPPGAEIRWEGRVMGATPADIVLPRGEAPLVLVLAKDGYAPHEERVVPDVPQRLRLTLEPISVERATPTMSHPTSMTDSSTMTGSSMGFHRFD